MTGDGAAPVPDSARGEARRARQDPPPRGTREGEPLTCDVFPPERAEPNFVPLRSDTT